MSQTIQWFTADELRARRDALLAKANMTLPELHAKQDAYLLDLEGHALLEELEGIEYLLNGD